MDGKLVSVEMSEETLRALEEWREAAVPQVSRLEAVDELVQAGLSVRRRSLQDQARRDAGAFVSRTPSSEKLAALFALEAVGGFGPVKFREMHEAGVEAQDALDRPESLPFKGRIGEKVRAAIRDLSPALRSDAKDRAVKQIARAEECSGSILIHGDAAYPKRVYASNNPVPVLYVRGDPGVWADRGSVVVVGSRQTREPYASGARQFAKAAIGRGLMVVSGFALGADSIGHRAAREANGYTVCVMPCGLDSVFPPENRELWEELLSYRGAAFVSEFGFGQRASTLSLRKRNKLIVAFGQGVLIAQSGVDGGAMNAYRFGREQKKTVATFRSDGSTETDGNAAIADDPRTGRTVFEATGDERQFERWLDELSWSI